MPSIIEHCIIAISKPDTSNVSSSWQSTNISDIFVTWDVLKFVRFKFNFFRTEHYPNMPCIFVTLFVSKFDKFSSGNTLQLQNMYSMFSTLLVSI